MRLTLLTLLFLTGLNLFSQTVVAYREAPLTGGGQYFLNGTAIIEEFDDGSFQFRLSSDYSTNSGPDVHIYLTNNSTFATPINLTGTLFVEDIGTAPGPNQPGISHFSGAYMKSLPTLTSLTDFDHVVFTCFGFGQLHWGNGSFGTIMTTATGINDEAFGANFKLFPNPATGNAFLELGSGVGADPAKVVVTDVLGSVVYVSEEVQASRINLATESLKSGMYFVQVSQGESQKVMRLLKQ